MKSSTKWLLGILIFVVLAGAIFIAYYFWKIEPTINSSNSQTANSDWQTYSNSTYGFSLKYPEDWILKEENTNDNILVVQSDKSLNPEDAVVIQYYSSISILNDKWEGSNNATTIDEFIVNAGFQKLGTVDISGINSSKFLEGALGGNNFDILTMQNGHVFMFQLIGKEQLTDIDSQILSTFQFTR